MKMDKYCNFCSSILREVMHDNVLSFNCNLCGTITASDLHDTLRIEVTFDNTLQHPSVYEVINNDTNKIHSINCKCGGKIGKIRLYSDELKSIIVCLNCEKLQTD